MNRRFEGLAGRAVMAAFCLAVIVPFAGIVLAALNPPGTVVGGISWPEHPTLASFGRAWSDAGFGQLLRNSTVVAAGVVPLALVCASLAGYAFALMEFRGRKVLFAFLMLGLALPYEAAVVPLYYDLRSLGLTDTPLALILALVGLFMPFGAFWMREQFLALPKEMTEAAAVDGAGSWTVLWKVLLPCARPALITLGLLYFLWAWNQFLLALILIQNPAGRTAPAGLGFFVGAHNIDVPLLSAATLIVIAPVVAVYLFFQRHFIAGMLAGAVKG
ncbi:carbohydrate ABC transporter permease [Streptomyces sp. TLI_171]|uniref:carbohydrate ABC transporter permease n=1 Tax=Streptomyces sp. TLI_171 TaxID=1938859 RepID=UPI000C688C4F|nr:carbohydrate ABC transporter permease [Streptomyces sp. TLI_171]RKE23441.1 carbohydrate ABC transporter membrane protein 2 (CUT1 family) [Streptomyces sp. TLI_171]